jgi:hypothetical protein
LSGDEELVGEFDTIKNQSLLLAINVEATAYKSESGPERDYRYR